MTNSFLSKKLENPKKVIGFSILMTVLCTYGIINLSSSLAEENITNISDKFKQTMADNFNGSAAKSLSNTVIDYDQVKPVNFTEISVADRSNIKKDSTMSTNRGYAVVQINSSGSIIGWNIIKDGATLLGDNFGTGGVNLYVVKPKTLFAVSDGAFAPASKATEVSTKYGSGLEFKVITNALGGVSGSLPPPTTDSGAIIYPGPDGGMWSQSGTVVTPVDPTTGDPIGGGVVVQPGGCDVGGVYTVPTGVPCFVVPSGPTGGTYIPDPGTGTISRIVITPEPVLVVQPTQTASGMVQEPIRTIPVGEPVRLGPGSNITNGTLVVGDMYDNSFPLVEGETGGVFYLLSSWDNQIFKITP